MSVDHDLRLARRIHRLRTLGLGLGFLCVASVFREQGAHPALWALLVVHGFVWPHAAYGLALRSSDPRRMEFRSLMTDSLLGGAWVALMGFNTLPSVLLVTMLAMDKIAVGGGRLLARMLAVQAVGALVTSAAVGFRFAPTSSPDVVLACIPFLVAYPLAISAVTHALSQRVLRQNRLLEELSRTDSLTGLPNRARWEEAAASELRRSRRSGRPSSLLMIDVDRFKEVNDRWGHPTGDELLRELASILRKGIRDIDTAARYGGDEFAVVLPEADLESAIRTAERLREQAEQATFPSVPDLRFTISIGAAESGDPTRELREWVASADAALYKAKASGRNCTASPALIVPSNTTRA
jgi:diguanylate cyclase